MTPFNPDKPGAQQIPVFTYEEREAEAAFVAFAALRQAIRDKPELADNPYFMALVDTASALFRARFEVVQ